MLPVATSAAVHGTAQGPQIVLGRPVKNCDSGCTPAQNDKCERGITGARCISRVGATKSVLWYNSMSIAVATAYSDLGTNSRRECTHTRGT